MPDTPLLSRLAAMKAGKAAVKPLRLPDTDLVVGIRPMSSDELQEAAIEAASFAARMPEHPHLRRVTNDVYERELTYRMLLRSLVDPQSGKPLASSADELKTSLDWEVAAWLSERVVEWQEHASPDLNGEEDPDALAEELGKAGPSETPSAGPEGTETPSAFSGGRVPSSPTASSSGSTSGSGGSSGTSDDSGRP